MDEPVVEEAALEQFSRARRRLTTHELAGEVFMLLARLNRASVRVSQLPIPPAQARLLAQIDDLGRPRLGELAIADGCAQPTLSTQARRLESAGWVSRERDDEDARAVRLKLTPSGQAVLAELRAARATSLTPYIAALTASEQAALVAALPALHQLSACLDVGAATRDQDGSQAPTAISAPTTAPVRAAESLCPATVPRCAPDSAR